MIIEPPINKHRFSFWTRFIQVNKFDVSCSVPSWRYRNTQWPAAGAGGPLPSDSGPWLHEAGGGWGGVVVGKAGHRVDALALQCCQWDSHCEFYSQCEVSVNDLIFHTHCWRKLTLLNYCQIRHSPTSPNHPNMDQTYHSLKRPTCTPKRKDIFFPITQFLITLSKNCILHFWTTY